ncbi:unnamed protein product [Musa acuminata subsp. malaccensis]|uniref:(wild Malaysian banana) hypothetical protein n=1 Tax=Musa acuminata subsp. malaccensis TaxID=214687 RepID=A0A804I460_MUSAM|nr:unnamed protein product [Musa acuminata subsp. malaccensis]
MASLNPFDPLADDDNDDPSHFIAIQQQKVVAKKPPASAAAPAFPSKPVPPTQAVREARSNAAPPSRGGAGWGGTGRGKGGRGGRDLGYGEMNGFSRGYGGVVSEEGDADKPSERGRGGYGSQRQLFRGGRRGGYGNVNGGGGIDSERPPRRIYERHSGSGRGYEMKREGAGRGNWGTTYDDLIAKVSEKDSKMDEKLAIPYKQAEEDDRLPMEVNKEASANENEEKEMTLEEYEKIKEEKRKALLAMKPEGRKVEIDKDFESMQQLSIKKGNDDVFVKLGSDKDTGRRKDNDHQEQGKKHVPIPEFLKPAEGERYYSPGGRGFGRGRGRGDRGSIWSEFAGETVISVSSPSLEDPGQFPALACLRLSSHSAKSPESNLTRGVEHISSRNFVYTVQLPFISLFVRSISIHALQEQSGANNPYHRTACHDQ